LAGLGDLPPIPPAWNAAWACPTDPNLRVEVVEDEIIVTLPGTRFDVTYQRCVEEPGLVAKSFWITDDQVAPITRAEFLALAWEAANDKARELGWIE
jgi:hypothetical protein